MAENINTQSDIKGAAIMGYGGIAAIVIMNIALLIFGFEPTSILFWIVEPILLLAYIWFTHQVVSDAPKGGADEWVWLPMAAIGALALILPFVFHAAKADVVK